jgi:phage regulator Rha-like protein
MKALSGCTLEYKPIYLLKPEMLPAESGTSPYRQNIYHNIAEGLNYIYEGMEKNIIIKPLTEDQKEVLNDISRNKWFRVCSIKEDEFDSFYDSLQVQLIEKLGIKVYFDENNKPYVFSHEVAKLVNKRNVEVMDSLRLTIERFAKVENSTFAETLDISMVEDKYISETNNKGTKENITYRLSKDLIMNYILGLNGEKFTTFKFQFQSAFNYIEQQYNKLLIENGKLKESFYKMYNEIRIRNRELLISDKKDKINKKIANKKVSAF